VENVPIGAVTIDAVVDVCTQLCLNKGEPIKGMRFEARVHEIVRNLKEKRGVLVVGERSRYG